MRFILKVLAVFAFGLAGGGSLALSFSVDQKGCNDSTFSPSSIHLWSFLTGCVFLSSAVSILFDLCGKCVPLGYVMGLLSFIGACPLLVVGIFIIEDQSCIRDLGIAILIMILLHQFYFCVRRFSREFEDESQQYQQLDPEV